jgi:hypothetical protein
MCLNISNFGLTNYNNYNYIGLCTFKGKQLGCDDTGIYEMDRARLDDNGTDINLTIRTGFLYLEKNNVLIRVRNAILGYQSNGDLVLTVITENEERYDYSVDRISNDDEGSRIKFGKGLKNRYLMLEISNIGGSTMELDKIKVYGEPVRHKKR